MTTKQCPRCGESFEGRANKLYCSHRCKMAAFYGSNGNNGSTVNGLPAGGLTVDGLPVNGLHGESPGEPSTVSPRGNEPGMVAIPVSFTSPERELLEKQADECGTTLSRLIRIRSLMDETDIWSMRDTITEQGQQIEELRVKLSFFHGQAKNPSTVVRLTDKPVNGLLIAMNERQSQFLTAKYLESIDYESPDSMQTLPDGSKTRNERVFFEYYEREKPGYILDCLGFFMLSDMLDKIGRDLVENCGYDEDEVLDNPLPDEFEKT